jgi:hypothetical protein
MPFASWNSEKSGSHFGFDSHLEAAESARLAASRVTGSLIWTFGHSSRPAFAG